MHREVARDVEFTSSSSREGHITRNRIQRYRRANIDIKGMVKSTDARGPVQRHFPSVNYTSPIHSYRSHYNVNEPERVDLSLVIVPQCDHALRTATSDTLASTN